MSTGRDLLRKRAEDAEAKLEAAERAFAALSEIDAANTDALRKMEIALEAKMRRYSVERLRELAQEFLDTTTEWGYEGEWVQADRFVDWLGERESDD